VGYFLGKRAHYQSKKFRERKKKGGKDERKWTDWGAKDRKLTKSSSHIATERLDTASSLRKKPSKSARRGRGNVHSREGRRVGDVRKSGVLGRRKRLGGEMDSGTPQGRKNTGNK